MLTNPIVPSAGHGSASPSAAARTEACIPPPAALASQAARRRRPDPAPENRSRPRQGAAALVAEGASPCHGRRPRWSVLSRHAPTALRSCWEPVSTSDLGRTQTTLPHQGVPSQRSALASLQPAPTAAGSGPEATICHHCGHGHHHL